MRRAQVVDVGEGSFATHAALVALVTIAYLGFGWFAGGGYDPGRDVATALAIVREGARPLEGPLIAGQLHLGPLWFYVLALPLAVQAAWLGPAMLTVAIAASAFPLAYAAGRRLGGSRLGALWVVALAMPGWGSFESVAFANTSIARAATLGTLLLVLRATDAPRIGLWFAAGLVAAIAVHAHPSCAWLMLVVVARAWSNPGVLSKHVRDGVAAIGAALLGFALPFVPVLLAPAPMLEVAGQLAGGNVSLANLARVPALLGSVAWSGPQAIFAAVFAPGLAWPRHAGMLVAAMGAIGALRAIAAALGGDRASRWGVGLTVLATVFVALARPVTPVYMAYSIVPVYALAVAAGWRSIATRRAAPAFIVSVIALAAALAVGVGVVRSMRDGGGRIDGAQLADITRAPASPPVLTDIWLYAASVDPLGRALCADPAPVFGALGYALDVFYAMPIRLHCPGAMAHFTDAGAPAGEAPRRGHVSLAMRRFHDLGIAPARRVGGIGLTPVARVIVAAAKRDLPRDATYPPHAYESGAAAQMRSSFAVTDGELVVVSNPRATWMPAWDVAVQCDGRDLAPATGDLVTRVYRCVDGRGGVHRLEAIITAARPEHVEIVTFLPRSGS